MRSLARFVSTVLLATALPASAQYPRLEAGPASLLSAPGAYAPAPGAQLAGAIVSTPAGWTAIWADDIMPSWGVFERHLLATRIGPDGAVRDTTGIRITSSAGATSYTIVPDAGGARVFWVIPNATGSALHTATISDDGTVSGEVVIGEYPELPATTPLAAAAAGSRSAVLLDGYLMIVDGMRLVRTVDLGGYGELATVTTTGSYFVVTWVASGGILMRQTLDLDGNVKGPAGGTGVAFPARLHSVASDGSKSLLAWSDANGIHISIVDPDAGTLTETGVLASAAWASPRVAWTGSSYLVAWTTFESRSVLGVRVSADGTLLDTEPQLLHDAMPGHFELAARGSETMMLFETGGCIRYSCETDVYATRLGAEPFPAAVLVSAAARTQSEPAIASDGANFLTLWREGTELFVSVTADRSRAASAPISLGEAYGVGTSVASTGNGYLATWVALRDGHYFIEGTALTSSGEPLPQRAFSFDAGSQGPHILSTGASSELYLVVWREGTTMRAVRLRADGELLDPVPFPLRDDELPWSPPSVAFDGTEFVVGWLSSSSGVDPAMHVLTQRVTTGGIARPDHTWATGQPGTIQHASMSCGGDTCLQVWTQRIDPYGLQWQLFGVRFRSGGEPIDGAPLWIDFPDVVQTGPAVSWDGNRFVVTWRKYIGNTGPEKIEARTVPASGPVDRVFPDQLFRRDAYHPGPVTACNRGGRCVMVAPDSADDAVLGRTTRLFKRFFGEARHRAIRR